MICKGTKISDLELAVDFSNSDLVTIVQDSINKKMTATGLIANLSNTFAIDSDLQNVKNDLTNLDTKVDNNYIDLQNQIIEGDLQVTQNLTSTIVSYYDVLNNKIVTLEIKHDQDIANINQSVQEWIDEIADKSTLEQLQEALNRLTIAENWITILAELIAGGGGSGEVPGFHTQSTATIFPLTGYYRTGETTNLVVTDTLNQALSKLEGRILQVEDSIGGDTRYLIKMGDQTLPTDGNLYSALRSQYEFLNKQSPDTANGKITFLNGWQGGASFLHGFLGYGSILENQSGKWFLEVDNLFVRGQLTVNELTINEINAVGGEILVTVADMEIIAVEDKGNEWWCYFDTLDGTKFNKFRALDQAICQKFDGQNVKRYWRLVNDVGTDYIALSKFDCEAGSADPEVEDKVLQLGHRTDTARQNAILISAQGSAGARIITYDNIVGFDLTNKDRTTIGRQSSFVGTLTQVRSNGDEVRVPVDLGAFVQGNTYYYYDRVSYNGSLWLCIATQTTEAPDESKPYIWQLQVDKGESGIPGTDTSQWVEITGDRIFFYPGEDFLGTPNPLQLDWEANVKNIEDPQYKWFNTENGQIFSTSQHCTILPEYFTDNEIQYMRLRCEVIEGTTGTMFYDEESIGRLHNGLTGKDAIWVDVSNSSITVPYDSAGVNPLIDLNEIKSYIRAYDAQGQLDIAAVELEVVEGTAGVSQIILLESTPSGGFYMSEISFSSLSTYNARIVANVGVEDREGNYFLYHKDIYFNQAREGEDGFDGVDAASVRIAGAQNFHYDSNNQVEPVEIALTASVYGVTGGAYNLQWAYSVYGQDVWTDIEGATDNVFNVAATFGPFANGYDVVTFRVTMTTQFGSVEYYDTHTIVVTRDGKDGSSVYAGFLTNETHTVGANHLGETTAAQLLGAETNYYLKYGSDTLNYGSDYTIQVVQPVTGNTSTYTHDTANNLLRITSLDKNYDTTVFKVQFLIPDPNNALNTIIADTRDWTITKAKAGAPGDYDVLIYAYRTTQPSRPTFLTVPSSAGASGPDGTVWYTDIPSGVPIWMTKATFDGSTNVAKLVGGYYWSLPTKITGDQGSPGANGSDGSNGDYTVYMFGHYSPSTSLSRPTTSTHPAIGGSVNSAGATWYRQPNQTLINSAGGCWVVEGIGDGSRTTSSLLSGYMKADTSGYYWSVPSLWTGKAGADGREGRGLNYRGEYSSTATYYLNDYSRDVVYRNTGTTSTTGYYMRANDSYPTSTGYAPESYLTGTSQRWTMFGASFESIATGLLFANEATIAGWVFNNNYIHSANNNVWLDGRSPSGSVGQYPISIGPNAANNPSGGLFIVDRNGYMSATGAKILNSSYIGNWYLGTYTNSSTWYTPGSYTLSRMITDPRDLTAFKAHTAVVTGPARTLYRSASLNSTGVEIDTYSNATGTAQSGDVFWGDGSVRVSAGQTQIATSYTYGSYTRTTPMDTSILVQSQKAGRFRDHGFVSRLYNQKLSGTSGSTTGETLEWGDSIHFAGYKRVYASSGDYDREIEIGHRSDNTSSANWYDVKAYIRTTPGQFHRESSYVGIAGLRSNSPVAWTNGIQLGSTTSHPVYYSATTGYFYYDSTKTR